MAQTGVRSSFQIIGIVISILLACSASSTYCFACDIAVVSAKASSDGRPFIWKSRDNSENWYQQTKYFEAANPEVGGYIMVYDHNEFTDMITGTPINPSGGVNEAGFAIACTSVYEQFNPLHELINVNTTLIDQALKSCITLSDFDDLMRDWWPNPSNIGKVISGNFVVIDAHGGAALYECFTGHIAGELRPIQYKKYNANTGRVTNELQQTISGGSDDFIGFHNRTNSNTYIPWNSGEQRRWRATELLKEMAENGRLNFQNVMREVTRDVEGDQSNIENSSESNYSTTYCISRAQTRLGLVVDGVADGDDPARVTFWCALGEPSVSVFTPYFPHAESVSYLAWVDAIDIFGNWYDLNDTCLLNRITNRQETYDNLIYSKNTGSLLWGPDDKTINKIELTKVQKWTLPLENLILDKTEEFLGGSAGQLTSDELQQFSDSCAQFVYDKYQLGSSCCNFEQSEDPYSDYYNYYLQEFKNP